jgi:hypothetical protein
VIRTGDQDSPIFKLWIDHEAHLSPVHALRLTVQRSRPSITGEILIRAPVHLAARPSPLSTACLG